MRQPLLILIAAAFGLAACSKQVAAPEPVRAVKTLTVASGAAGGVHEYAAEIRARTESRLSFRVGGKMTRRLVDVGAAVKPGQALAQLDPQDLRLGQDAARATAQAAQVNLDLAQADFSRYKELRDQGFISGAELERRDTTLKAAHAQFQQARAQASAQVNQTAYAVLLSDVAGVVTGVDAEPGAVVAAGTPVLRLAHDGPRDAVFSVPEDQLSEVRALVGRPGGLKVRLWGDDAVVPATVREIAAAADTATRTFQIKADVGRADVRLGQTATALIDLPQRPDVIKLPLAAVMEQQGRAAVWVVDGASMTVKAQTIQVAGADANNVLVSGGLSAGQRVVSAGVHVLSPGQKVTFYGASATAASGVATR